MTHHRVRLISPLIASTLLAAQVLCSPLSPSALDAASASRNDTDVVDTVSSAPAILEQEFQDEDYMIEDCTLKALDIILSEKDEKLNKECKDILVLLTGNAGKQKQTRNSEDADLSRELNELAKEKEKYATLSEQIQNAESLLAERDFTRSNENDIEALRDLDNSRTMRRHRNKMMPNHYENQPPYLREAGPSEEFWNGNFVTKSKPEYPSESIDDGEPTDEDLFVIPMRYLRKTMLRDQKPLGFEFEQNNPSNAGSNRARSDKAMMKWLLQAMLSLDGRQQTTKQSQSSEKYLDRSPKIKNDPMGVDRLHRSGSLIVKKDLQDSHDDDDLFDQDPEIPTIQRDTELATQLLYEIQSDIQKLRKDLQLFQGGPRL